MKLRTQIGLALLLSLNSVPSFAANSDTAAAAGTSTSTALSCASPPGESFAAAKDRLGLKLLLGGLSYAREHSNPVTGFVEDTVGNYQDFPLPKRVRASISSTGFLMALVADLYSKGLVSRAEAYRYCARPLRAVLAKKRADLRAAEDRRRSGAADPHLDLTYHGWFAHFIDWSNGDRWIDPVTHVGVEYATSDSTWFLSGGIVCAETFPHSEVARDLNKILSDVDFNDLRTNGGAVPEKLTLSMSYTPDDPAPGPHRAPGYSKAQWEIYQHSWLVYLLGMGAPRAAYRLPLASWSAWRRSGIRLSLPGSPLDGEVLYGDRRALFSHYFPDVFMPPSALHEACGVDYFRNSQLATRFNKAMAAADTSSKTFASGLWGLDAGPNPDPTHLTLGAPLTVGSEGSTKYGVNTPYKRNGTACLACAVTSAMFEPDLVFTDLRRWCDSPQIGPRVWGKYGPTNGINLDLGWTSPYALSGVVGPMALGVANLDPATSVWRQFVKSKAVQRGLAAVAAAPLPPGGCLTAE